MPDLLRPCVLCYDLPPPYSPRHFLLGPDLLGSYLLTYLLRPYLRGRLRVLQHALPTMLLLILTMLLLVLTTRRTSEYSHMPHARATAAALAPEDACARSEMHGSSSSHLVGVITSYLVARCPRSRRRWHGCMGACTWSWATCVGWSPDLALRYHLILLCPMPTH